MFIFTFKPQNLKVHMCALMHAAHLCFHHDLDAKYNAHYSLPPLHSFSMCREDVTDQLRPDTDTKQRLDRPC